MSSGCEADSNCALVDSEKFNGACRLAQSRPQPVYKRWWLWTIVGVVVAGAAVGVGVGVGTQKSASFNANLGTVGPAAQTLVRF